MSQEFDLYMYEQIVEHRKRLLIDIEHLHGCLKAQSEKISELTLDKKLLYEDLQKAKEEIKKLQKEKCELLALIPAKPL